MIEVIWMAETFLFSSAAGNGYLLVPVQVSGNDDISGTARIFRQRAFWESQSPGICADLCNVIWTVDVCSYIRSQVQDGIFTLFPLILVPKPKRFAEELGNTMGTVSGAWSIGSVCLCTLFVQALCRFGIRRRIWFEQKSDWLKTNIIIKSVNNRGKTVLEKG